MYRLPPNLSFVILEIYFRPSADPSKNEEVQCVEWNDRPSDHEVDVKWNKISVRDSYL